MRDSYLVLLAIALATCAEATSTKSSLLPNFTTDAQDIASTRLLRGYEAAASVKESSEDRATGIKLLDDFFENQQFKMWAKKGVSAANALSLTKFDDAGNDIFASPSWRERWIRYVKMLGEDPEAKMASALTTKFGGSAGLVNKLTAAKAEPATAAFATKLERAMIRGWLNRRHKPNEVFAFLQLEKSGAKAFETPQFATWLKYLNAFNEKYPQKKTTVLQAMKASYASDEGALALAKMVASMDDAGTPWSKVLKHELVTSWMYQPNHPENIFKMLKLDEAGDALLSSPGLATWAQYMKAFNKEYPHAQTTMIQTFTKSYGDEKLATMIQAAKKTPATEKLAANLQTAQFKQWMVQGKTPDDVYKTVLKLESTTSPNADIWRAFYKAYDEAFPGKLFSFKP